MVGRMLLILFIGAFVLEAWLFLAIGERIGLFLTLAWIFGSFFLGIILIRLEGVRMLFGIHAQLQRNVVPTREVLNGLAVVLGGLLLALPGYFTDSLGILLLFPFSRSLLLLCVVRSLDNRLRGEPGAGCQVPPSEEIVDVPSQPARRSP